MPARWTHAPRILRCHDAILVTHGSGEFTCEGHTRAVKAPAWVLFPAGAEHSMHGRGLALSVVHFDASIGGHLDAVKVFCPEIVVSPSITAGAEEPFNRAIDAWRLRDPVARVCANRWMELWFAQAFGRQGNAQAMDPRLVRALAWIHENLGRPFLIREAAQHAGASPAHLRALFHRYLGASPKKLFQEIRLNRARQLLEQDDIGVAEAAYRVGWHDLSGFSRSFHRRFGASPGAWRRSRGQPEFPI